jgi:hypothetical protein
VVSWFAPPPWPSAAGSSGGGARGAASAPEEEIGTGGARKEGVGGEAQDHGVLHVRRATGLGQGERLPVGHADMHPRRRGRAAGGAAVGAGARLPVGLHDVRRSRVGRAPGESVQVAPMKSNLTTPETKHLKLK